MAERLDTVLGKAVAILQAFAADDRVLTLAEITRRTGLHKASAHRLCGELVAHRLLDRLDGGYRLSGGLFELGMRASEERSLSEVAIPFLQDLYERTHETVHLGVREKAEVVYLLKIGGHQQARSPSRVGGRMPMHCTAIGLALLAHSEPDAVREVLGRPLERRTPHTVTGPGLVRRRLARVRGEGVAYEHEESAVGITCVAAPVLDERGLAIAAISVAGPVGRFRPEQHAAGVHAAAVSLTRVLRRRSRQSNGL